MTAAPPQRPWKTGKHAEYTSLALEVRVAQDIHGQVFSEHDFKSDEDREAATTLPTGGARLLAHALLAEAVRRECFLDVMIEMTKDPEFLTKWENMSDEDKRKVEGELALLVTKVLHRGVAMMVSGGVRDILEMISSQD